MDHLSGSNLQSVASVITDDGLTPSARQDIPTLAGLSIDVPATTESTEMGEKADVPETTLSKRNIEFYSTFQALADNKTTVTAAGIDYVFTEHLGFSTNKRIGGGQYAHVYRCDNEQQQTIAIKVPREKSRQPYDWHLSKTGEVNALSLRHRHIVSVEGMIVQHSKTSRNDYRILQNIKQLDATELQNYTVKTIVMEYLEGPELHSAMINKRIEPGERSVVRVGLAVSSGLDYLHKQHIVHHDIKTGNIVLSEPIKIVDFGFSERLEPGKTTEWARGAPGFLAPEVVAFNRNHTKLTPQPHDHKSDNWSLGAVLFEVLFGSNLCRLDYDEAKSGQQKPEKMIAANQRFARLPDAEKENRLSKMGIQTIHPDLKTLLIGLLHADPNTRITAEQAHSTFKTLRVFSFGAGKEQE